MKRGIVLYRLDVAPGENDGEGECFDEWFSSLKLAKKRRQALIAEDPDLKNHRWGVDFAIWRVEFAPLPPRALLLRVLNNGGAYVETRKVEAYVPPRNRKPRSTPAITDLPPTTRIFKDRDERDYDEGHGP